MHVIKHAMEASRVKSPKELFLINNFAWEFPKFVKSGRAANARQSSKLLGSSLAKTKVECLKIESSYH